MIAFLKGDWEFVSPALLYVSVNGVGYEVNISLHTYSTIQNQTNGKLFTYLQIKEDAHTIYGFADISEKELFMQLISVSGIGANTARMMLSSKSPDEINKAIINGDTKALESIKGIGKKTAERTIVELRDKLAKQNLHIDPLSTIKNVLHSANKDALNALLALGIARNVADNAVQKAAAALGADTSAEAIIKKALQMV